VTTTKLKRERVARKMDLPSPEAFSEEKRKDSVGILPPKMTA
jgi:hypothetical protein